MQAKQYLKQAKRISSFIRAKEEELEILKLKVGAVGAAAFEKDKVQASLRTDKLADNVIAVIECEEKISRAIDDLRALHSEISEKIDAVDNDDYRLILFLRYLNLKEWESIAAEMNFSYSHTLFLHKRALEAFEEKHKGFLSEMP